MGCDIHHRVEYREPGGHWQVAGVQVGERFHQLGNLTINRDYRIFQFLAGVRGSGMTHGQPPLAEPKGKPDDLTLESEHMFDEWASDGHSHSWLTLRELQSRNFSETLKTPDGGDFRMCEVLPFQFYFDFIYTMAELGKPDDVRLVFCFDN